MKVFKLFQIPIVRKKVQIFVLYKEKTIRGNLKNDNKKFEHFVQKNNVVFYFYLSIEEN